MQKLLGFGSVKPEEAIWGWKKKERLVKDFLLKRGEKKGKIRGVKGIVGKQCIGKLLKKGEGGST